MAVLEEIQDQQVMAPLSLKAARLWPNSLMSSGVATNNVAEYSGLLAGLTHIHQLDAQATIEVAMDSKLVVEQMSGRWQIKHADMRDLAKQCRASARSIVS